MQTWNCCARIHIIRRKTGSRRVKMKHPDRSAGTVSTWVDTHAHLDDRRFDSDRDAVLERARESGVVSIVTVGVDLPSSRAAVALAERYEADTAYPEVYAAVGVHPNAHADAGPHSWHGAGESSGSALRDLLHHPRVVAVGEIGLDYYWDECPRDVQQAVLEAQLDLAAEACKPVIVHIRDQRGQTGAYDDTLAILRVWLAGLPHEWCGRKEGAGATHLADRSGGTRCIAPGVLHCFSGTAEIAQSALHLGFYLGVDGPVTYPNASARPLQAMVAELPLERLLLETDCPYLAPQAHRGKRNEPAYLPYIGYKVAELKGIDACELAEVTTLNAQRLFHLDG
jgi:TatD DNase family protein